MVLSRRLLFRSGMWEIARPRHPLTAGHVLIRLSDPSTEFVESSAADWLFCHDLARLALRDVLGANRCSVMFAHQWHALGSAVGEPVAESSTPTFHLFGRWDGETTTPGRQLTLPAHRRAAEPEDSLEVVDAGIRESLRLSAPGLLAEGRKKAPSQQQPASGVVPVHLPVPLVATIDSGPRHSVIQPGSGVSSISEVGPGELVALGAALGALPLADGVSGFSCVAVESEHPGSALRIHALGRSAAEDENPMVELFNLPEVSLALL